MARQIQVFIPLDNNRLPLIRHYLKSEHDVHGLTHFKGTENDLFLFKCREKDTGAPISFTFLLKVQVLFWRLSAI